MTLSSIGRVVWNTPLSRTKKRKEKDKRHSYSGKRGAGKREGCQQSAPVKDDCPRKVTFQTYLCYEAKDPLTTPRPGVVRQNLNLPYNKVIPTVKEVC